MNIVLFDSSETNRPLPLSDERARHILRVLRRDIGDAFDVDEINGPRGKARIESQDEHGLRLHFNWAPPHAPPPPTSLIIGLPRPQTARDILRDATTLGASTLHFVATARSDPNYATSSLWQNRNWHRHVVEGAAQSFDTYIPAVTSHQQLAAALQAVPAHHRIVMLDNYGPTTPLDTLELATADASVTLCLGPERGWADADRALLAEAHAERRHLGERVLRLETATTAALTLLNAIRARQRS